MEILLAIVACVLLTAFLGGYVWLAAWAVGDAQKRGYGGGFIVLLFWVFGPLAALIWLTSRPKQTLVERGPDTFNDIEDALAAASQLDSQGDWDAAAAIYRDVAESASEHAEYARNCLTHIESKQQM